MQNSEPLVFLGFAVLATTAIAILLPYLRGKSDILTAWNIMLLGGALFIGIGCLGVAYGNFHWPELQWFQPSRSDVQKYIVGVLAFYITLYTCYFWFTWPRKVVAPFLNKWPPMTAGFIFVSVGIFVTLAMLGMGTRGVPVIGSLFFNISHKAIVFAVVFTFCFWYQNKRRLPILALFIGVFLFAAMVAIVGFRGRRLLLSVAVAPMICMYWLHWRYLPPRKNLFRLVLATSLAFVVAAVYSTFRHFDSWSENSGNRSLSSAIAAIKTVNFDRVSEGVTQDVFYYFSQYCGHYSLLTIHLIDNGQIEVEPLHTLRYLVSYPIPRVIWPNKPQSLGIRIVTDILRLPYPTNWGLGIVGNGYHEGGIPTIVLYAVLMVLLMRLLDDALLRQPNNVFLLGILCCSAPHFAAFIRGDPTVMSSEIMESFAFAWAFGLVARMFFGTAAIWPAQHGNSAVAGRFRHVG